MLTKRIAIKRVQDFADQIIASGLPLKRVVLFGSYSRNGQHSLSDIDVALISDRFSGIGFYDTKLFGKTLIKRPFWDIQPRTYNTKDFSPDKDAFVEEILKTGIEIKIKGLSR
jgi:predicted nucleotidyltransferase